MAVSFQVTVQHPSDILTYREMSTSADIQPTQLLQRNLQEYTIPLLSGRVWDAVGTNLPTTSATDDLGIYFTHASTGLALRTYDVKTLGAKNIYALYEVVLPPNYVAAETVQLMAHCDMSAAADTSCTIDMVAYRDNENYGIGSDLVSTAATSINSTTEADYTFTVTATTLYPSDRLLVRLHIAVNDAAGGAAVIATIGKFSLLCDTQGG